jgi:putative phosphoesterase
MKLAILSDIHSNIHALNAVAAELNGRGDVDVTVCAGDVVGYGAFPNECCRAMSAISKQTVLGNHDLAALNKDTSFMNPYAAEAVLWTSSRLDDGSRRWLQSLAKEARLQFGGLDVAMYHGSVGSCTEYVFEEDATESMLTRARCDLLVLGHTHVPYVKRFPSGLIVNPGSVGQPRDGDPRTSYALLDTDSRECEILRLDYDIDDAANAIESAGLPLFLADRLSLGR